MLRSAFARIAIVSGWFKRKKPGIYRTVAEMKRAEAALAATAANNKQEKK